MLYHDQVGRAHLKERDKGNPTQESVWSLKDSKSPEAVRVLAKVTVKP